MMRKYLWLHMVTEKTAKNGFSHLSEKLLEETPMQQEVKERTVVILGSKGEG